MNEKENSEKQNGKRQLHVVLQQHFLPSYRKPIFNLLCKQEYPNPRYSFLSDTVSQNGIKTIDFQDSEIAPQNGGLHWEKTSNVWFGKIFLWQSAAIRLAFDKKIDCIIFLGTMYHLSTWISAIFARIRGKRVLMWTHGYLCEEKNFKGWVREKFYRLANGLLVYGHRSRDLLLKRGFDSEKIYVVYNSLNYEQQCRVREKTTGEKLKNLKKQLFVMPDLPVLIYIGRLTPQKKLSMLLKAAQILKKNGFDLNVIFIGDGPERYSLEQDTIRFGITNNVVFYGPCYDEEEIGPLIMLSDICVSPGEIGLTCMHVLAYGTPVITHNNSDLQMPEWEAIRPSVTGAFFQHGNSRNLAQVIKEWLEQDTPREQIRVNCYKIIDHYYNATYQAKIINCAVRGISVTDLLNKDQTCFTSNGELGRTGDITIDG
jgi:glycosyltransferase involved in cell wall biosynthesis